MYVLSLPHHTAPSLLITKVPYMIVLLSPLRSAWVPLSPPEEETGLLHGHPTAILWDSRAFH